MNEADLIAEKVTEEIVRDALADLGNEDKVRLSKNPLDENLLALLNFAKYLTLHIVDNFVEDAKLEACKCMNPLRPRDLEQGYCGHCFRNVAIVVWRVRHDRRL